MNTEHYIRDAFYILCRTQNPHKISINAIIKKAGINRSTFYYYYQDKINLIHMLQNDVLEKYFAILKNEEPYENWIHENFSHYPYPAIYANCYYVEKNIELLKVWTNDLQFINKFSEMMVDYLKSYTSNDTLCIFLANGTIGLLRNWVNEQPTAPFDEIVSNMIYMVKSVLATE